MKNHRDVCKAGFTTFDGLPGQVNTGCPKKTLISNHATVLYADHVYAPFHNYLVKVRAPRQQQSKLVMVLLKQS